MSTHNIEIIEIGDILPHPNPEVTRMELTNIWGWQCCIGKGQFKKGDRAIYIPPDFLVPLSHPLFKFLDKNIGKFQERIRVRRLKGVLSQGLLVQVPLELSNLPVGTNVIERLGIERYEQPCEKNTSGLFVNGPSGLYTPKFDVENYQRYPDTFVNGEMVIVTEKIHGENGRFVYGQDKEGVWQQFCGSRTSWMAEDNKNIWWMTYGQNPQIGNWCKDNPNKILYGEVFGQVQDLKYSAKTNDIFCAIFAVLDKQTWVDFSEAFDSINKRGIKWAPILYHGPFSKDILTLAEGPSLWPNANHIREGCVIVPGKERTNETLGRVCLKVVSNEYLERY